MTRSAGAKVSYYSDGNLETVLKRLFAQAEDKFVDTTSALLIRFNELLLSRTPVWSGDMIHNWRWSTRAPNMAHEDPIEEPFWEGHPPGTALGAEPRRRANITRPRQSLAGALRAKTPLDIYLTNTSEHAVEVETGIVPTRAQPGFLRLTLKEVFGGYI